MATADIGIIGLAVMGQNLILNINDHGFTVACFNRTTSKVDEFLKTSAKGTHIIGCHDIQGFIKTLKRPRKIILLVKAGSPVDDLIEELLPFLEKGDILIDGGNSHFPDTERRLNELASKGILFVGCGVSGGEEGARFGPSLMPGGSEASWPHIKPILQAIAAKVDNNEPCCDWIGSGGAGHFVKMVHNGIEYGDIQLICEAYDILYRVLGLKDEEIAEIFLEWNKGELESFLIEITAEILRYKDKDKTPLIHKILDVAGQKGTGKWTVEAALDEGVPLSLISEAVFARSLSALKAERVQMSKFFPKAKKPFVGDKKAMIENIRKALYASKIISYTQGYMLMREASSHYKWNLNYGSIALVWRAGCIIRSRFLGKIKEAFDKKSDLQNLLLDDFFHKALSECQDGWRKALCLSTEHAIPAPCFTSALSWFDGMTSASLPANLLQAMRDYFGAHTYERIDSARGTFFHTNWTGRGGTTSASTYNA
jgi:6-phosphogluconate dehydrogenase